MTSRGRANSTDWDPMKEDYNDTLYDQQYADNDSGQQYVNLDHKKLYITNIPQAMNENGLRMAFEEYGQIDSIFISKDPNKRYALVAYDTPVEARVAMMNLNRTEPLNLVVALAHARHSQHGRPNRHNTKNQQNQQRNQDDSSHCGDEILDESMGSEHTLHLELEKIKLDELRIQEERLKCRKKMVQLQLQKRPTVSQAANVSSSRRLLPDGRVIVQERVQEPDASFTAGAGDSLNIPGLQRVGNHSCIVCGAHADLYCARCSVTPYCSEHCQRRDWTPRHSAVCHNLVRVNAANYIPADIDTNTNVSIPPPPAPLRRPRSPNSNQQRAHFNGGNDNKKKFAPQTNQYNRQPQDNQWRNKENKPQEKTPTTSGGGSPSKQKMQPKPNYENPKSKFDGPKKNFEAPKSNFEASKSNFEASKSNVEAPKSNFEASKSNGGTPKSYEAPKPNFEAPKPKLEMPKEEPKQVNTVEVNTETSVKLSAPEMVLVPSEYLIEKLPIGEAFLASVDKCTPAGFVCVSMHAQFATLYETLLGEICEGDTIVPKPGTTFAYFDSTDEGWYRARCLNATECALLDAGRVGNIGQGQCKPLAAICADIPEFCCVVNNGKLNVGMSVQCTILMKEGDGYKVSIDADDTYLGEGTVTRWLPEVQVAPKPKVATHPLLKKFSNITSPSPQKSPEKKPEENQQSQQNVQTPQQIVQTPQEKVQKPQQNVQTPQENAQKAQQIQKPVSKLPEVERPDIINNGRYVLLHVTSFQRACVRACDEHTTKEFESVIQDAALYGAQNGKRLTEAPSPGQAVLCLYEGVHYRALVTRTKAADNRFKVEYVEYSNEEIVSLDKLFHCPPELCPSSRAARASLVSLSAAARELAGEALAYLDALKEEVEVVATIPTGEKTAPSGSLVHLSIASNKENINKKLEQMCTPEWKKLEIAGGDVIESNVVMLSDLKTLPLPTNKPFTLRITDLTSLKVGIISGYDESTTVASVIYGSLTDKINEYCKSSLCKEPYIPAIEEVCLARLEPYPQWFRAVVISHKAGEETASVLYLDYGNVGHDVPVRSLRKCMPEFCAQPALASIIVIQDWPETVTDEQLIKALQYLEVDDEGTGKLLVSRCQVTEDDTYTIKHEQLLAALRG